MNGFVDSSALFAVAGHVEAARIVHEGLVASAHRGRAGLAVAVADGAIVRCRRVGARDPDGVVSSTDPSVEGRASFLAGGVALGQTWGHPVPGLSASELSEPMRLASGRTRGGALAVALAGRLVNGPRLRRELLERGVPLQASTDAELILHLVAASAQSRVINRIVEALWKLDGGFSLVACTEDRLVAVRDPQGRRPLVLGYLDEALVLASDESAIRAVGGEPRREVGPGEMVVVDGRGVQSLQPFPNRPHRPCVREGLHLVADDGRLGAVAVHSARKDIGRKLAARQPCADAEVVVAPPGAHLQIAAGYAQAAGLALEPALQENPTPRTRVVDGPEPSPWRVLPGSVEGRVVVLVVAGIDTGRLLHRLVAQLHTAGALRVHLRSASPPTRASCPFGVESPTVDELATTLRPTEDALVAWLDVGSFGSLGLDELGVSAVADVSNASPCVACLSGERLAVDDEEDQLALF